MHDSIRSPDTIPSALLKASACLPRVKARAPFAGAMLRHSGHADASICSRCPVQKLSICSSLQSTELASLSTCRHTVQYERKAGLIDQDQPAQSVDIVIEGAVRQYKTLPDGRRQIVGFALPGDFVGLAADDRNSYSAEALGDVSICRFTRKVFDEILDFMPHLLKRQYAMLANDLNASHDHLMLLGHYSARQKLSAFLLRMRNRWRRVNGASEHVQLPMPRQDIADYLGLTIETVSRTMSLLVRQKLVVVVPDGVRILDMDRLVRAAGE